MINVKLPKTARQSVGRFIDGTVAVCRHHGMHQRRQRYLISAGNNQNNLRGGDYLSQILPFNCFGTFDLMQRLLNNHQYTPQGLMENDHDHRNRENLYVSQKQILFCV